MNIDAYTKTVLTIIAACLVWLSFGGRSLVAPVEAQQPGRIVVAGWIDEAGVQRTFASGVPVRIVNK